VGIAIGVQLPRGLDDSPSGVAGAGMNLIFDDAELFFGDLFQRGFDFVLARHDDRGGFTGRQHNRYYV
jgi:hypothetical protein